MVVAVRVPVPLRRMTNGQDRVCTQGGSLTEVIVSLDKQFPGMRERLCDEHGQLKRFINVYVNGEDIRFLSGLCTATKPGDEISFVPAVAGG